MIQIYYQDNNGYMYTNMQYNNWIRYKKYTFKPPIWVAKFRVKLKEK